MKRYKLEKNKLKNLDDKQESDENKVEPNENFDWDFIFDREWSRTKK